MSTSKIIGQQAENVAQNYLEKNGLKLIKANYNCKIGEIDLIMEEGVTCVFIEVRYRKEEDYGDAIASITPSKRRKIVGAAKWYLQEENLYDKVSCRFDVIAVPGDLKQEIVWIKDAFWAKW